MIAHVYRHYLFLAKMYLFLVKVFMTDWIVALTGSPFLTNTLPNISGMPFVISNRTGYLP